MKKIIFELLKNPYKYSNNISIERLVKILEYCTYQYYQLGKPVISDDIYDILLDVLKDRDPTNNYLKQVGNKITKNKKKVNLPYYMGSLDKIKMDSKALDKWNTQFKGPYITSDKIDGVSALYYYDSKNKTSYLYTRGNGNIGQDISFLLQSINTKHNYKKDIYVRGELIISKKDFITLKENTDANLKNARNTVAGIVNSKPSNYNKKIAQFIQFVAYEIMNIKLIYDQQLKLLDKIKFKTPYHKIFKN
jgi:NAD-dependent DNA ligase